MRTTLIAVGTLLPLIAAVLYVTSIFKGKSLPQRTTRFLLVIITAMTFGSLLAQGDTSGVWLALASFVECALIWALSFRHGMGGRDSLDIACIAICLSGLALWLLSSKPWVGLIAAIIADLVACMPALVKTVRFPHTESGLFYVLGSASGLAIIFAGPLTLEAMAFPAYIVIIDAAFVVAIWLPRKKSLQSDAQKIID